MIYTVNFTDHDGEPRYSVFNTAEDAMAYITSRHESDGHSYILIESSEDGGHSKKIGKIERKP